MVHNKACEEDFPDFNSGSDDLRGEGFVAEATGDFGSESGAAFLEGSTLFQGAATNSDLSTFEDFLRAAFSNLTLVNNASMSSLTNISAKSASGEISSILKK